MSSGQQDDPAVKATQEWLAQFVIQHNLCPFAAKPFREQRIRYARYAVDTEEALVDSLIDEILLLKEADPQQTETSLVIVPAMLADFLEYNQFLDVADALLAQLEVVGMIQIASFHPDYQFADLSSDDVRNYTNRSPYPMFHLIREDSIEQARGMMDTDAIPERNMALLLELGIDKVTGKGS